MQRINELVAELRGQLSDEHADEVQALVDAMLQVRQLVIDGREPLNRAEVILTNALGIEDED